ncbi:MAG: DUF4214 domain-containing protein [Betaproteobacteria bacterium]|nr:DUF4214 domain-containing protein [Betaproteobacteria bacterium]
MKTIRTFLRTAAATAALALAALPAAAQSFNAEFRLSNQSGPSLSPTVAATGNNVYVVWAENIALGGGGFDSEVFIRVSTTNGTSWNATANISNNAARQDTEPFVAANGANVVVAWTDSQANGEIYYVFSTNAGVSFSAPAKITTSVGYSRPSGIIVDASGRVHVAYYDNSFTGLSFGQVFYMCSNTVGGAFNAPVSVLANDGVVDNEAPRIALAPDGTLYMLYRTSRNGAPQGGWPPFDQYLLRTSAPVTSCSPSWLYPAQKVSRGLPEELANTYGGSVYAGPTGALHAAWWADKAGTNLYYRKGVPNGAGFGPPIDISRLGTNHLQWDGTAAELSVFGAGEDAANNTHFVFADRTSTRDGYLTGNLFYTCLNSAGALQAKIAAKSTGSADAMQPRGIVNNGVFHMVWSDFRDAAAATTTGAEIYYRGVNVGACSITASPQAGVSVSAVAFGGQSMGTTAPAQAVTVTNIGTGTLTISNVAVNNAQFAQTNNCTSLASGASCTVNVTFTPAVAGGALLSTTNVTGNLTLTSNGVGSPNVVSLTGTGEKSLVTHYYRSILRRAPDGGGKAFWESEATRLSSLGANVNETWFAMATFFYFSGEYTAFGRNDTEFVSDLYNTFFNRPADGGGLAFWIGQISAGVPREIILVSFMFSTEFQTFAQGIFGNTAARKEVDTVIDFYRGVLSRLPDTGGFNFWVQQFRTAQCSGAAAVNTQVESISGSFMNGGEYIGRNRTNAQFVGDLYNSFLRRGGDQGGVLFWIGQLNGGAPRNSIRQQFITTPEFQGRVAAIIAQGCLP